MRPTRVVAALAGRRPGWRIAIRAAVAAAIGTVAGLLGTVDLSGAPSAGDPFPVTIRVDASKSLGALRPIWRFFGADEPNYTYLTHGRALLSELGKLAPGRVYFRAHNLLTSGDGTPGLKWGSTNAYREDEQGRPIYDWTILDRIFDACIERGVKPYVEIGFMPEALSTRPQPYRHSWTPTAKYSEIFTGWAYPPKDYRRWADLVHAWVSHSVERYGRAEVEQWYWETWNEPNIGYWQGTPEEFHKLHDYAVDAVHRALPTARVGGPHTAGHGGDFMRDFLDHVLHGRNHATGRIGTPLDFVSFHAKGAPTFVDGHVRMGISNQLATIDQGFRQIAARPALRRVPIIIGESDPEGCAACQGPQLGYRNGTMYSSYTAASFARKYDLAARHGVELQGAVTWAFQFEDSPYFAGFRALATNGLALPVLNVFRMFSMMAPERVAAESDGAVPLDTMLESGVRERPDVAALASRGDRQLTILAWHYHDDDVPGPDAAVRLEIEGMPGEGATPRVRHFRIDRNHSNSYAVWQEMGSPASPTPEQYARLEEAGRLAALADSGSLEGTGSRRSLSFTLPRQGVSLVVIDW